MPSRRPPIPSKKTILVVVEGDTEKAFCLYLKSVLSRGKNLQVNIRPAHGGSPDKIVEFARRQMKQFPHDCLVIVFDTDKSLSPSGEKKVRQIKAETFRFTPCIEGFFLEVIGQRNPGNTPACKQSFHAVGLSERDKLSADNYERIFPITEWNRWCSHQTFVRLHQLFSNEENS